MDKEFQVKSSQTEKIELGEVRGKNSFASRMAVKGLGDWGERDRVQIMHGIYVIVCIFSLSERRT